MGTKNVNIQLKRTGQQALLWALAAFFSWATFVLAAGPLKALRVHQGAIAYWAISIGVGAALAVLAGPVTGVAFLAICMLIGLDHELECWGVSRGAASAASIFGLVAFLGTIFGVYLRLTRSRAYDVVEGALRPGVEKLKEVYPVVADRIDLNLVVQQVPSAIVIVGLIALALSKMTFASWLRLVSGKVRDARAVQKQCLNFKVWEPLVFVLMFALLAAFLEQPYWWIKSVGLNAVNVLAVLYFFQGFAVCLVAMDWLKFGPFARLAFGFLLLFQFALFVAVVGLADYWLDLRRRMIARSARSKKTMNRVSDEEL